MENKLQVSASDADRNWQGDCGPANQLEYLIEFFFSLKLA